MLGGSGAFKIGRLIAVVEVYDKTLLGTEDEDAERPLESNDDVQGAFDVQSGEGTARLVERLCYCCAGLLLFDLALILLGMLGVP
jgi:hypothetical protein